MSNFGTVLHASILTQISIGIGFPLSFLQNNQELSNKENSLYKVNLFMKIGLNALLILGSNHTMRHILFSFFKAPIVNINIQQHN